MESNRIHLCGYGVVERLHRCGRCDVDNIHSFYSYVATHKTNLDSSDVAFNLGEKQSKKKLKPNVNRNRGIPDISRAPLIIVITPDGQWQGNANCPRKRTFNCRSSIVPVCHHINLILCAQHNMLCYVHRACDK